tara:strand:- start:3909 stop:4685 length:777 start_codon:yes stop_codon:yes gene_type:complete
MRIDDFIGRLSKYGVARNHRWTIMFGRTDINNRRLSDMCQSITIPSRGFEYNDVKTFGPGRSIAGVQTYGDELKMEFLCGNDMYERQIFSSWMDTIVNPITNSPNYYTSYICDATVKMYDLENNLRYALKFYEVYPTSVETFDLSQSSDDPFVSTSISFYYRKYVTLQAEVAVEQGEEQQADTTVQQTKSPPTQETAKAKLNGAAPQQGTTISYRNPPGEYTSNDPSLSQEEMAQRISARREAVAQRRRDMQRRRRGR